MVESVSSSSSANYMSMLQSATKSSDTESSTNTKQSIIDELKNSASSSNITAQQIVDDYGVSLSEAQEILEELNDSSDSSSSVASTTSDGYTMDDPLPEGSTVSYHV